MMIKYSIMSFMLGFAGNKLFGKDKSNERSMIVSLIVGTALIALNLIIIICMH